MRALLAVGADRTQQPPAQRIALKVNVETYRGTLEGCPRLMHALRQHCANATFLFALGPDHTGRAIKRVLQPTSLEGVSPSSLFDRYGFATLLYGTLLPGPDIGKHGTKVMRNIARAGFEVGIHAWDHIKWQGGVGTAGAAWTTNQMALARRRFEEIFQMPARVHGAADWQMNIHAYRLTQRLGFDYSSDTRGWRPFVPVYNAEIIACPQVPTTLPTFDELIGQQGINASNVANAVLQLATQLPAPCGHVFTVRAELEGLKLLPAFEQLLSAWRARGIELMGLRTYLEAASEHDLPRHCVREDTIARRRTPLAVQGEEFLAPSTVLAPSADFINNVVRTESAPAP
jgi:undecaprenyl phosphate-alpha-L-ara4FN deformylase